MAAQDYGLTPDLEAEQEALFRRRKIGEALLTSSRNPIQGRMVGRTYVRASPLEGLAAMFEAAQGRKEVDAVDTGLKDIRKRYNEGLAKAVEDYTRGGTRTIDPTTPNDDEGNPMPSITVPVDPRERVAKALMSPYEQVRALGKLDFQASEKAADREDQQAFRAEQAKLAREQRQHEIEMRLADARTTAADRAALQRELAQMRVDAQRDIASMNGALRRDLAADRAAQGSRPPPGYRFKADGSGLMEPIPGGPADTKIQGAFNADTNALNSSEAALNRLSEQVNLVKNSNLGRITGVSGMIPNVPGGEGADARARLDTLKAQVGFTVLQALKDAAKSGSSGLGQVTEKEHAMLQQQLGNLERAQSEKELRRVLGDIAKFADESKGRLRAAYNMKHGAQLPSDGDGWGVVR